MVSLRPLALLCALWPWTIHTTSGALRNTVRTVPHLRQWRFEVDAWEMKLETRTSAGKSGYINTK
jgi:hypothetical protein